MRNSFLAAAISAGAFVVSLSAAQAGTLIPVPPVQGSTQTWIGDINESNIIAGDYFTPDGNVHGFFGTLDGQYTFFDHPNGHTIVHGISNDGYITGTSNSLSQDCPAVGCTFVRSPDGAIFAVEKDGVPVDGFADEVIQRGRFVGEQWYVDQNLEQLFIYGYYGKGRAGRADLVLPFNTTRTRPRGFDKNGTVTGYFRDPNGSSAYYGFILKTGIATQFAYPDPNAWSTMLEYFNAKGIIAGYWEDQLATYTRPFLLDMETNRIRQINVNGGIWMFVRGINTAGLVALNVGYNADGSDNTPYIYCSKKATCPNAPNAIEIPDKWIPAPAGSLHSVVCRNRCLGPSHATGKPANPEAIRDAMKNDPALRAEMGLMRLH